MSIPTPHVLSPYDLDALLKEIKWVIKLKKEILALHSSPIKTRTFPLQCITCNLFFKHCMFGTWSPYKYEGVIDARKYTRPICHWCDFHMGRLTIETFEVQRHVYCNIYGMRTCQNIGTIKPPPSQVARREEKTVVLGEGLLESDGFSESDISGSGDDISKGEEISESEDISKSDDISEVSSETVGSDNMSEFSTELISVEDPALLIAEMIGDLLAETDARKGGIYGWDPERLKKEWAAEINRVHNLK